MRDIIHIQYLVNFLIELRLFKLYSVCPFATVATFLTTVLLKLNKQTFLSVLLARGCPNKLRQIFFQLIVLYCTAANV